MKINGKASKHEYITDTLRREILGEVFAPGTRLPVQGELAQRFRVGSGTITNVLQRLSREGFLTSKAGVGTIVQDDLPHLNNIAVALPVTRDGRHWSKFYTAIANAVPSIRAELGRPIRILEGLDNPHSEARRDLIDLVQTHQVAGILFATSPHVLIDTPILNEPGVPRMAIMCQGVPMPGIDTRIVIGEQFMDQALDYLASRGRRRIAIFDTRHIPHDEPQLQQMLAARNMVCPPWWTFPLSIDLPVAARHVTRLMMRAGQADRPDGLVVMNDNLVDETVAGLVAEGIKVPDDLEVVAHCNFPWPPVNILPIKRLGVDVCNLLRLGIDLIDRRRLGETVPQDIILPAVFEEAIAPVAPR